MSHATSDSQPTVSDDGAAAPETPTLTPAQAEALAEARRIAYEKAGYQRQRAESRRRHQRAGGRDMVISLAVIMVPVLLIVWFFQRTPSRPPVTSVDIASNTRQARAQAQFPVLAPAGLPAGWTPVRADWTPAGGTVLGHGPTTQPTWIVGYQGSDDKYYEVDQQGSAVPTFVADYTRHAASDNAQVNLGGVQYTRYSSSDGNSHYLVHQDAKSTTVVGGDVPEERVEAFASTLSSTAQPGR